MRTPLPTAVTNKEAFLVALPSSQPKKTGTAVSWIDPLAGRSISRLLSLLGPAGGSQGVIDVWASIRLPGWAVSYSPEQPKKAHC